MRAPFLPRTPRLVLIGLLTLGGLGGPRPTLAADVPQRAPAPKEGGDKICEWKSAEGVVYAWRGPKSYDAEQGVGLTLILHGSNLSHGWGFANHGKDTFRPDDLVVCPDGTTSNGKGGFNFFDSPADVKKLHALIEELKKAFKVRGTYLYGHSQGSFFALKYAGDQPDDVDGVVAHASGLWNSSQTGKKGHHQAIVFMHGTQDPVVPYGQSVGGYEALKEAGYPMLRLRSLEGWNHWPAEHNGSVAHTSQQLAWVEGMTTKDPERLKVCFDRLADAKEKEEHDWAGLYALAKHVLTAEHASEALKARATKAVEIVEALGKAHAAALDAKPGSPFAKQAWVGHLPIFLRSFMDVPAREELYATWKDTLVAQQKAAVAHLNKYWPAMQKAGKEADAFEEGVAMLTEGFLTHFSADGTLRENLATWEKDAKKLKLGKKPLKDYAAIGKDYGDALKQGWQAFAAINNKADAP